MNTDSSSTLPTSPSYSPSHSPTPSMEGIKLGAYSPTRPRGPCEGVDYVPIYYQPPVVITIDSDDSGDDGEDNGDDSNANDKVNDDSNAMEESSGGSIRPHSSASSNGWSSASSLSSYRSGSFSPVRPASRNSSSPFTPASPPPSPFALHRYFGDRKGCQPQSPRIRPTPFPSPCQSHFQSEDEQEEDDVTYITTIYKDDIIFITN